ncbi:MAG: ATP-binding cassette domain-containing protein [Actinomycetota bacterium]|jgi:iron complex transport system ATP-binding protein|nr:ATP-binding cassette domain-containing protein [Actinomycetota bacterium]
MSTSPGDGPVAGADAASAAVRLAGVSVVRDGVALLDRCDLEVGPGQRWAVLGPNGSGKTTLLRVAGAALWPTSGTVEVLGHRLGTVDLRALRERIGLVSAAVSRAIRPTLAARDVVLTGRHAALETWWHEYGGDDVAEANELLAQAGMPATVGDRPFGLLSEGERQQVLIARARMGRSDLLLFDEPAAGLDLGARERLVAHLDTLAADPSVPPLVLVTHHVEELPPGITHVALVRSGRIVAAGEAAEVLAGGPMSACFGLDVEIGRSGGRWWARAGGR